MTDRIGNRKSIPKGLESNPGFR